MAIQRRMSIAYVVVSRPFSARDDVTNSPLDPGMTFDGVLRELEALESLESWRRGLGTWQREGHHDKVGVFCQNRARGRQRETHCALQGSGQRLCAGVQCCATEDKQSHVKCRGLDLR